jgi:hypothetical protein
MRYVEIVTGRARQRGIGGNHEASARQKSPAPPRNNGAPTELRCGVGLAASTPRSTGSDAEVGRAQPAERDARVGGIMCGSRPETAGGRIRAGDLHIGQLGSMA